MLQTVKDLLSIMSDQALSKLSWQIALCKSFVCQPSYAIQVLEYMHVSGVEVLAVVLTDVTSSLRFCGH